MFHVLRNRTLWVWRTFRLHPPLHPQHGVSGTSEAEIRCVGFEGYVIDPYILRNVSLCSWCPGSYPLRAPSCPSTTWRTWRVWEPK